MKGNFFQQSVRQWLRHDRTLYVTVKIHAETGDVEHVETLEVDMKPALIEGLRGNKIDRFIMDEVCEPMRHMVERYKRVRPDFESWEGGTDACNEDQE